nr:hypothetical protein [Tanacetum cinerariifolium]
MVAFLQKPTESDGFEQIVDFLNAHPIREVQLHAWVDGKEIVITELSLRRDLQLAYEEGIDYLLNSTIFEQLSLMGLEAEHDNGNIHETQSKATPNESSFEGTNSVGGPRCQETMRDTIAQTSLKKNVKKLKKRNMSRTHKLKRLYKERRIDDITADEDITLVSTADDEMLDVDALDGEEVKWIVIQELGTTTTRSLQQPSKAKIHDKGNKIMIEEPVKTKKKDQIMLDEEAAIRLQAEFDDEEKLVREKKEANIALTET